VRRDRQREARLQRELATETAQIEAAELAERREREAAAAREREERDREARRVAHEAAQRLAAARRAALDAQDAFEVACSQLAAGAATLDQVERVQLARDRARRTLEIWEMAAADARADPALTGRR
jgi:hypothetical protein